MAHSSHYLNFAIKFFQCLRVHFVARFINDFNCNLQTKLLKPSKNIKLVDLLSHSIHDASPVEQQKNSHDQSAARSCNPKPAQVQRYSSWRTGQISNRIRRIQYDYSNTTEFLHLTIIERCVQRSNQRQSSIQSISIALKIRLLEFISQPTKSPLDIVLKPIFPEF